MNKNNSNSSESNKQKNNKKNKQPVSNANNILSDEEDLVQEIDTFLIEDEDL